MNVQSLQKHLTHIPIPEIRYFDTIGSTNDEAMAWAGRGNAADGCLVIADQQTQGRGRFQRRWVTRPGAALAFSIILHPTEEEMAHFGFFSPLGALAICQALEDQFHLTPQIKWPNDVLLQGRKAAGILVEAAWIGQQLQGVIIGIGLNIRPDAVPPANELLYPATSVENSTQQPIDREQVLAAILQGLFFWRKQLTRPAFKQAWEQRLAFKGQMVQIEAAGDQPIHGKVTGLDISGNLLLEQASGEIIPVAVGDVHLRPLDK
jgi:BirA family biotin operon repressor/biotin-[acetyl-CoA-carboxylase] ligase